MRPQQLGDSRVNAASFVASQRKYNHRRFGASKFLLSLGGYKRCYASIGTMTFFANYLPCESRQIAVATGVVGSSGTIAARYSCASGPEVFSNVGSATTTNERSSCIAYLFDA